MLSKMSVFFQNRGLWLRKYSWQQRWICFTMTTMMSKMRIFSHDEYYDDGDSMFKGSKFTISMTIWECWAISWFLNFIHGWWLFLKIPKYMNWCPMILFYVFSWCYSSLIVSPYNNCSFKVRQSDHDYSII